tara:strand:+ start:198 stop:392 length:195 start_codon:yes stop_codon:yes gene_type:complete
VTLGLRALSTKYQKNDIGITKMKTAKILERLIEDLELAIIKAKAQLEYIDKKEAYEILIGESKK